MTITIIEVLLAGVAAGAMVEVAEEATVVEVGLGQLIILLEAITLSLHRTNFWKAGKLLQTEAEVENSFQLEDEGLEGEAFKTLQTGMITETEETGTRTETTETGTVRHIEKEATETLHKARLHIAAKPLQALTEGTGVSAKGRGKRKKTGIEERKKKEKKKLQLLPRLIMKLIILLYPARLIQV